MNRCKIIFLVQLLLLSMAGCKYKNPYFVNDVVLISPDDEANLYRNQLLFKWRALDAFSNTLQVSASANFNALLVDTIADSTALITNVSGFDLGKTYYWQVLSVPNAGEVITSPTRTFTVIDTRDSLKGTYNALLRKQYWDLPLQPLKDTSYDVSVTINKVNWNKLKVICSETPSLNDLYPHPDNLPFHFGNDGTSTVPYLRSNYDTLLRKIELEFSGGDSNTGYHYWFTIYK